MEKQVEGIRTIVFLFGWKQDKIPDNKIL